MRKVVLGLGISLDGYNRPPRWSGWTFSHAQGLFDGPVVSPPSIRRSWGRKTYDVALKMGGGGFGNSKIRITFSLFPSLPGERSGVTFVNESPKSFVEKLREGPGKNVWLMGGGELARDFLKDDVVDELYIGIVPVRIGEGIPLFPSGFPQREFSLLENKSFSKGLIALKYARVRRKTRRE